MQKSPLQYVKIIIQLLRNNRELSILPEDVNNSHDFIFSQFRDLNVSKKGGFYIIGKML